MSDQRQLPIGDRDDDFEVPRRGELPSDFLERVAGQDYTPAAVAEALATCCPRNCRSRGWKCQSEAPFEERLERITREQRRGRGEQA